MSGSLPRGRLKLNRAHALADRLQHYFLVQDGRGYQVHDLASGYIAAPLGATRPSIIVDAQERTIIDTDYGIDGLVYSSSHIAVGSTYTLIARIRVDSFVSDPQVWAGDAHNVGGQMLRFRSLTRMDHAADGDWESFTVSDLVVGEWQTHVVRRQGSYAEYLIDGTVQDTTSAFLTSSVLSLRHITGDSTDRFNGGLKYLIGWKDRYLSDTELRSLAFDPYQVLRPTSPRRYSFLVQGEIAGTGSGVMAAQAGDAVGSIQGIQGASTGTLGSITASGLGDVNPVLGSGAGNLEAMGALAAGAIDSISGAVVGLLSGFIAFGTGGTNPIVGIGTGSLAVFTATGTGEIISDIVGEASGSLAAFSGAGAGEVEPIQGAAAGSLDAMIGASEGSIQGIEGAAAALLRGFTGAAQGEITYISGVGTADLGAFVGAGSGAIQGDIEGTGFGTLSAFVGASTGSIEGIRIDRQPSKVLNTDHAATLLYFNGTEYFTLDTN